MKNKVLFYGYHATGFDTLASSCDVCQQKRQINVKNVR